MPTLSDAEKMTTNWNTRGACTDSFRLDFADGWAFPWGSNHLSGVEVLAHGALWPKWNDTNAVLEVATQLSIVPGVTTFSCEYTPSNTYRAAWVDAAANRDTNTLVSAVLELMRNGDRVIATNGAATCLERELPFPHDGFGQDDAWVAANFTNATEILQQGYAAWVDAQVGEGLTNGLYKLTVSVAEAPPEATLVTVGECSVVVTNAGDYVFLLAKGIRYDLSASSDCANDFWYSAVDDVHLPQRSNASTRGLSSVAGGDGYGQWSSNSGELHLFAPFGFVAWTPTLSVSPVSWRPSRINSERTFSAAIADMPDFITPTFAWHSFDSSVCSVSDAYGRSATMSCHFPNADGSWISLGLDVTLMGTTLHAHYGCSVPALLGLADYEENVSQWDTPTAPQLMVVASPSVVFFEQDTVNTNKAGVVCFYQTASGGEFEVSVSGDACSVVDDGGGLVSSEYSWTTEGGVFGARHFFVESGSQSSSPSGTVFSVSFTPDNGTSAMTGSASVTFTEVSVVAAASWPNDQARGTLGVFEDAAIYLSPMIQNLSLSGKGTIDGDGSWSYYYTAPGNATTDVIRNSDGTKVCSLDIIAPSSYEAVLAQVVNRATHICEAGSFEMLFKLSLQPKNVSFANIEVMEQGMSATNATGYFVEEAHTNLLSHSHLQGAWRWIGIGEEDNDAGDDTAGVMELSPPWGAGGFLAWPIPNVYRRKGGVGAGEPFCNTDQNVTLEPNGTVWLEKFNRIESCTTNRQFNGWIRTVQ